MRTCLPAIVERGPGLGGMRRAAGRQARVGTSLLLSLAAMAAAAASPAWGQDGLSGSRAAPVTVTGRIIAPAQLNARLGEALVTLIDAQGGAHFARADLYGTYRATGIPVGKVTISTRIAWGAQAYAGSAVATIKASTHIDLRVQPSPEPAVPCEQHVLANPGCAVTPLRAPAGQAR